MFKPQSVPPSPDQQRLRDASNKPGGDSTPLPLARSDVRDQKHLKLVERLRGPAVNHPKIEVAAILGIDQRMVYKIGKEFGVTFKAPTYGGTRNVVPK